MASNQINISGWNNGGISDSKWSGLSDSLYRMVGLDHGVTNPTAVLWAAINYDGTVFIYDEHYKSGETVSYHASEIKRRDNSNVKSWLIDPSCNAKVNVKNGQFYSIVDEYRDEGLYFYPANNDVLSGINRVAEYFKSKRLFIFKNCVNLINEINQYKWQRLKPGEEKNQPDKPVKHMDHTTDVLRYLIASRAFATEKSETPRVGYFSPAYWSDRQETYEEKFV
jgi:phage terminase large subunit